MDLLEIRLKTMFFCPPTKKKNGKNLARWLLLRRLHLNISHFGNLLTLRLCNGLRRRNVRFHGCYRCWGHGDIHLGPMWCHDHHAQGRHLLCPTGRKLLAGWGEFKKEKRIVATFREAVKPSTQKLLFFRGYVIVPRRVNSLRHPQQSLGRF